jgi:hypothetical protein
VPDRFALLAQTGLLDPAGIQAVLPAQQGMPDQPPMGELFVKRV